MMMMIIDDQVFIDDMVQLVDVLTTNNDSNSTKSNSPARYDTIEGSDAMIQPHIMMAPTQPTQDPWTTEFLATFDQVCFHSNKYTTFLFNLVAGT
jgi:hypothetical protein